MRSVEWTKNGVLSARYDAVDGGSVF